MGSWFIREEAQGEGGKGGLSALSILPLASTVSRQLIKA